MKQFSLGAVVLAILALLIPKSRAEIMSFAASVVGYKKHWSPPGPGTPIVVTGGSFYMDSNTNWSPGPTPGTYQTDLANPLKKIRVSSRNEIELEIFKVILNPKDTWTIHLISADGDSTIVATSVTADGQVKHIVVTPASGATWSSPGPPYPDPSHLDYNPHAPGNDKILQVKVDASGQNSKADSCQTKPLLGSVQQGHCFIRMRDDNN